MKKISEMQRSEGIKGDSLLELAEIQLAGNALDSYETRSITRYALTPGLVHASFHETDGNTDRENARWSNSYDDRIIIDVPKPALAAAMGVSGFNNLNTGIFTVNVSLAATGLGYGSCLATFYYMNGAYSRVQYTTSNGISSDGTTLLPNYNDSEYMGQGISIIPRELRLDNNYVDPLTGNNLEGVLFEFQILRGDGGYFDKTQQDIHVAATTTFSAIGEYYS